MATSSSAGAERLSAQLATLDDVDLVARLKAIGKAARRVAASVRLFDTALTRERAQGGAPCRELWASVATDLDQAWSDVGALGEEATSFCGSDPEDPGATAKPRFEVEPGVFYETAGLEQMDGTVEAVSLHRRLADTLWASTTILSREAERFQKGLPQLLASASGSEFVTALADHLSRLAQGVDGLQGGLAAALPSAALEGADGDVDFELAIALELRTEVFNLRERMRTVCRSIPSKKGAELETAIRGAFDLLTPFIFGPGSRWMRGSDRRLLVGHYRALSTLLDAWTELRRDPAEQLLASLERLLAAMESINDRGCLIRHDVEALREVERALSAAKASHPEELPPLVARALAALRRLQGRDAALDGMLAFSRVPGAQVPVDRILKRVGVVLAALAEEAVH